MEATDILILGGLKLRCEDREVYNILNGLFIGKGSSGVLDIFGFEILA